MTVKEKADYLIAVFETVPINTIDPMAGEYIKTDMEWPSTLICAINLSRIVLLELPDDSLNKPYWQEVQNELITRLG